MPRKTPKLTREWKEKIRKSCQGINFGNKNGMWKGDKVGYAGLHYWVESRLGKPRHCAYCQRTDRKRYEWANISKAYKRELSDWIRLCRSCHVYYDNGKIKI